MTLPNNPFHDVATVAQTYVDVRPGYPRELLTIVCADDGEDRCVVDIGAGTGKLTTALRDLVGTQGEVWAIEPSPDMREQLIGLMPDLNERILPACGENTTLDDAMADIVFYAQSWHWVDPIKASREAARILRPGGKLVVLYNQMDVSIPWVKRLSRIMRSGDVHRPTDKPLVVDTFTQPQLHVATWQDRLTPDQVCQLGTTRSSWIRSTTENRAKMQANLRWYLSENLGYRDADIVEIPYLTYMWVMERV